MEELKTYFEEHNISIDEVARLTGYSVNYIRNLLNGSDGLNDKAIHRLGRAFPETRAILEPLPGNGTPAPVAADAPRPAADGA